MSGATILQIWGDTLVTTLADGTVTSTVAAVAPGEDPPDAV